MVNPLDFFSPEDMGYGVLICQDDYCSEENLELGTGECRACRAARAGYRVCGYCGKLWLGALRACAGSAARPGGARAKGA